MNADGEWDGVDRRQGERRERGPPQHVSLDGLSNGARRMAMWGLGLLTSGLLAFAGWFVSVELRDAAQDQRIEHNAEAAQLIDRALSQGQAETMRTVRQIANEMKALREEMQQNRNGIGVLDAEKDAIRRDFEREHGRRP